MKRNTRVWRATVPALLCCLTVVAGLLLRGGRAGGLLRLLQLTDAPYAPEAFGRFHLFSLTLCVCAVLMVGIWAWHIPDEKRERVADGVMFAAGILFLLLEGYKQLYVQFVIGDGSAYDFSVLPFQFCSLPLYICPVLPLLREGGCKRMLRRFLAFYGTVGGYLVMGYPNLPERLSLCLHTMLWHSLMILIGVFLLCTERLKGDLMREFLPAGGLFAGVFACATLFNVLLEPAAERATGVLNLYYMSPYHNTYFLVISDVRAAFGWEASVFCYLLLFWFVGALPLWLFGVLLEKKRYFRPGRRKMRKKHGKS